MMSDVAVIIIYNKWHKWSTDWIAPCKGKHIGKVVIKWAGKSGYLS